MESSPTDSQEQQPLLNVLLERIRRLENEVSGLRMAREETSSSPSSRNNSPTSSERRAAADLNNVNNGIQYDLSRPDPFLKEESLSFSADLNNVNNGIQYDLSRPDPFLKEASLSSSADLNNMNNGIQYDLSRPDPFLNSRPPTNILATRQPSSALDTDAVRNDTRSTTRTINRSKSQNNRGAHFDVYSVSSVGISFATNDDNADIIDGGDDDDDFERDEQLSHSPDVVDGNEFRALQDKFHDLERSMMKMRGRISSQPGHRSEESQQPFIDNDDESSNDGREHFENGQKGIVRYDEALPNMNANRGLLFLRSYQSITLNDLSLEEDTFSIMMLSKPYTKGWNLGMAAFAIQITLGSMILIKQIQALKEEDFAFKLDPVVLIGQGLTIMLCLSSQSDVLAPIEFFSFGGRMSSNWDVMIGEGGNKSHFLYMRRIVFPHVAKLVEGILVLVNSFFVILQSDDIIDLLKDFTALMVLSETDNVFFHLAVRGYFGHELQKKAEHSRKVQVQSSIIGPSTQRQIRCFVRFVVLFTIIFSMCGGWIYVVFRQMHGASFNYRFPQCGDEYFELAKQKFGDGKCYGGPLNTLGCEFEGGDCVNFNIAYPLCKGSDVLVDVEEEISNDVCNMDFAISACNYDGGDCCDSSITESPLFGDGQCHGGGMTKQGCGYDDGDCLPFIRAYPTCPIDDFTMMDNSGEIIIGNGICEGAPTYSNDSCGFENGDCNVGLVGQDLIFKGVRSGSSLDFVAKMSSDGNAIGVGMYFTDTDGKYDANSAGTVTGFKFQPTNGRWSNIGRFSDYASEFEAHSSDLFGFSLTHNHDATLTAFGSPNRDDAKGFVRVVEVDRVTYELKQRGQAFEGDNNLDRLGHKIDMTLSGSRLAISSVYSANPLTNDPYAGKIQIFHFDTSFQKWVQLGQSIYGDGTLDALGYFSLQLNPSDGSRVFFSRGHDKSIETVALVAYDFNEISKEWTQVGSDIENPYPSRNSPGVSADGNRIAISSYSSVASRSGEVKVLELNAGDGMYSWNQLGGILFGDNNSTESNGDGFGSSVSMNHNGDILAVASVNPNCDGNPAFCATGSIQLFRYKDTNKPDHPFALVPLKYNDKFPNAIQESTRVLDGNIVGLHLDLSGDGSKLSVSGYDFKHEHGFVKVFMVSDIFYVDCVVPDPFEIGNGQCDETSPYFTEACSYDGGDCPMKTVSGFPDCVVGNAGFIGDGICQDYLPFNSEQCGHENGDCPKFSTVEKYPNCKVSYPGKIGNGQCDDRQPYNGFDCGFDGGDCL